MYKSSRDVEARKTHNNTSWWSEWDTEFQVQHSKHSVTLPLTIHFKDISSEKLRSDAARKNFKHSKYKCVQGHNCPMV